MDILEQIRSYWDIDALTYDLASQHRPRDPFVQAAWTASLEHLLPSAPARILDCGAGTGFLSLIAARLGHRVTALDIAPAMLARLVEAADTEGLRIETIAGPADQPPGSFDVIMERHLLWTLPAPDTALSAWRAAAPGGYLVLVESLWGSVDPVEWVRSRARSLVARWRGSTPEHHAEYDGAVRAQLPLGGGIAPARVIDVTAKAGWRNQRVTRLRDVEWCERRALPMPERLIGLPPRFAVVADA